MSASQPDTPVCEHSHHDQRRVELSHSGSIAGAPRARCTALTVRQRTLMRPVLWNSRSTRLAIRRTPRSESFRRTSIAAMTSGQRSRGEPSARA